MNDIYIENSRTTLNGGDIVPNPSCCTVADALCDRCQAMADRHSANGVFDIEDLGEPLGVPTLNFANPFATPTHTSPQKKAESSYIENTASHDGIGLPQLQFENPFASL